MRRPGPDLAVQLLRLRGALPAWSPAQWDLLVRQARSAGLLARLGWQIESAGNLPQVPAGPAAHFEAAACYARAQRAEIEREIAFIRQALAPLGLPVILLKGAAYLAAGLPAAHGRLFSDTDILVPKARLNEAEAALLRAGWATTHHSAYDQRYYREWMHELPPLVHLRRQTALDVHHAIAPETARIRPDSARLIAAARPIHGKDGLATLAPADMVLHSMLHLLVNDELSHGLRDLSDLDLLLRHLGADESFWNNLAQRAQELGLGRILGYALKAVRHVLGTPVPDSTLVAVEASAPSRPLAGLMETLFSRAFRSPHPSSADPATPVALWMLYLRAHWLRMPPGLLAKHLAVKALGLHLSGSNSPRA